MIARSHAVAHAEGMNDHVGNQENQPREPKAIDGPTRMNPGSQFPPPGRIRPLRRIDFCRQVRSDLSAAPADNRFEPCICVGRCAAKDIESRDRNFAMIELLAKLLAICAVLRNCGRSFRQKLTARSPRGCDFALYRECSLVEDFFNKLKHNKAIATRFDKLASTFLAGALLICVSLWLN